MRHSGSLLLHSRPWTGSAGEVTMAWKPLRDFRSWSWVGNGVEGRGPRSPPRSPRHPPAMSKDSLEMASSWTGTSCSLEDPLPQGMCPPGACALLTASRSRDPGIPFSNSPRPPSTAWRGPSLSPSKVHAPRTNLPPVRAGPLAKGQPFQGVGVAGARPGGLASTYMQTSSFQS